MKFHGQCPRLSKQGINISTSQVWHFDDRANNIEPFRGTGMNAREISCLTRFGGWIGSSFAIMGSIHCHQQISRYHQCLMLLDLWVILELVLLVKEPIVHRDQKQGTGVCGATTQERFFVGFKPIHVMLLKLQEILQKPGVALCGSESLVVW